MRGDKKTIYFLVALIIFLSIILLIKIKKGLQYNPVIYDEIYTEYEEIFGGGDIEREDNKNSIQNIQKSNSIMERNNTYTTVAGTAAGNIVQGNVIGKIIIPKINITYPIIKETTIEYLKVAPTKYCGPEVNEIRKSGYSGA